MPREHRLKSLPPYFRAVVERRKPFEIRKDDRAFDEGDVLVLCEWDPMSARFTGAEVRTPVTYVMRGGDFGLERGFAVLALDVPETYSPAAEEKAWPPPSAADASAAGDVPCRCGDPQSLHAGGETFCSNRDCWCLKFIPTKEEASGAETEHRQDRPVPELRDAGRGTSVGAEGSDHHGGARGRGAEHERRDGRPGSAEPGGDVLQPGSAGERDPEARPLELAAQNLKDSHQDPEPRDQVAGVEGSTMREGPAHAPEQDREAGVQRLAGSADPGEGATASPAAARWGSINAAGAAWHLWRDRDRAECGETFENMGVNLLPEGTFPDPDYLCLDCRDLAGTVLPDGAADVEVLGSTARVVDEEGNDLAILGDVHEPAAREVIAKARATLATKPRCAGHNKSADVPCNTRHVHVERDGKWFCKRHDPQKPKKAPVQEAAA